MFLGELILGELFRGNCPGGGVQWVIVLGGISLEPSVWGGSCTGGNYLGVVVREGSGWQKSGGRGNCPEVVSCVAIVRGVVLQRENARTPFL